MSAQPRFLVLPGYEGSGPQHWQSHWEAADPAFQRVEQADWDHPRLGEWVDVLDAAVAAQEQPVVLVAHSLGCILVAHWAARRAGAAVAGAFLVAPADIEGAGVAELAGFCPIPLKPLPFPALVVASSDDPWCSLDRSRRFADAWGARLVVAGAHGHLNSASELGDWEYGRELLGRLLD
ncbi:alpha/beta hydrolase [Kitasatospora sp. RB6PN24]|uniref:RBBP9/YdeN family alpha/beta hydrolase n=1 Tax=Kitasatospora humi TaxID=2893891 RepID=UPI001E3EB5C7|nr:alpha/beta hydrolase [Kitasatospora humi]MCC9308221.1 alpha/beta hydrolase [Kitasatospora humi]